jgi:hypothetical protein
MIVKHVSEPQPYGTGEEVLVFQGILYGNQQFTVLPGHSTRVVRDWPTVTDKKSYIELQDRQGNSMGREPVRVTKAMDCHETASRQYHVYSFITLRRGVSKLLFYKDDALISELVVGEQPTLTLNWDIRTVSRDKRYTLGFRFSNPLGDAYLQIIYQWTDQHYRTIRIIDPTPKIELDFSQLPGGKVCRLVIAYTSGMRTVVQTTDPFSVPLLPATLRILRPREDAAFAPGHPITLEAEVRDRQNENIEETDLVWLLNGKEVIKGRLGCLQSLPEGKYELEVRLDSKQEIAARREFKVVRPKDVRELPANEWD